MRAGRVGKMAFLNVFILSFIYYLIFAALFFLFVNFCAGSGIIKKVCIAMYLPITIFLFALPLMRCRKYKYYIGSGGIAIKSGVLFLTIKTVAAKNIFQIYVRRGPIDKITGLAKLVAVTAGGKITVKYIENKNANGAEHILKQVWEDIYEK